MSSVGSTDGVGTPERDVPVASRLDPALALRSGRFDPLALLAVWCLRRASFPLLLIGLIGAAVGGELADLDPQQFQSMGELVDALLSPLAGVVLAIAARAGAAGLGWALAWPLARAAGPAPDRRSRRRGRAVGRWLDLLHLTRALRAWRWTAPVRELAVDRLGETGRVLRMVDRVLLAANPVLVIAFVAVVALMDAQQEAAGAAIVTIASASVASGSLRVVPDPSDGAAHVPPLYDTGCGLRIREPAFFEHRMRAYMGEAIDRWCLRVRRRRVAPACVRTERRRGPSDAGVPQRATD